MCNHLWFSYELVIPEVGRNEDLITTETKFKVQKRFSINFSKKL